MFAPLLLALAPQAAPPPDWVVPPGSTVIYDTALGPVRVNSLTVQPGGYLRIVGPQPFVLIADSHVLVDGPIDASGLDAKVVGSLFTPQIPEPGAAGAAGGGQGGMGSPETTASSPKGGDGYVSGATFTVPRGARGGESGYSPATDKQQRRGAGGGGGALGPNEVGGTEPGLVAEPGHDGHPLGLGAISGASPPKGGAVNPIPFVDGDPANDFWGRKLDAASGQIVLGELATPRSGVGGGAGGDSISSATFPSTPFGPPYQFDKKGAAGGGGGGLVVIVSRQITIGAAGAVVADGGDGSTGENVLGFDHIAGSSGGGSGGMILLEAEDFDLSAAGANALSARGGIGGIGKTTAEPLSKGGNGGPGLIQLHVRDAAQHLALPASTGLDALSAPNAHVLLPELY